MKNVKVIPKCLKGEVKIPPSKSLLHRAIIAAGLSKEECVVENVKFSKDIGATVKVMQNLGVKIYENKDSLRIKGIGKLEVLDENMDCCESGSTLRFLVPLSCTTGQKVIFSGKGKLIERPLNPYYDIFEKQGINYETDNGYLPLIIKGLLKPSNFSIRGDISSQFVTGLLLALPLLDGESIISVEGELQSKPYVDLTLDVLGRFGIEVENRNYKEFYVKGNQKYKAYNYRVEGDFSQAAFWIGAGVLGEEVILKDLNLNSIQGDKAIIDIVRKMGGNIYVENGKIIVRKSNLKGIRVDVSEIPDLVPMIAVLGALARGTTEIVNASRLRIKESDRLKAISEGLNKLGGEVYEKEDSLIIKGKTMLKGGEVDSFNDHRIAMALSVASIRCKESVTIKGSDSVSKSYPTFYEDFKELGGDIVEWNMGK